MTPTPTEFAALTAITFLIVTATIWLATQWRYRNGKPDPFTGALITDPVSHFFKELLETLIAGAVVLTLALGLGWIEIKSAPAIVVTARELVSDYTSNEIAAAQRYGGKRIRVRGIVTSFGKDVLNNSYVSLDGILGVRGVQCFLSQTASASKAAASLRRGNEVSLEGRVDKLFVNVLVDNCSFAVE